MSAMEIIIFNERVRVLIERKKNKNRRIPNMEK